MYKLTIEGNFFVIKDNNTDLEIARTSKSNVDFKIRYSSENEISLYGLNRPFGIGIHLNQWNTYDANGDLFSDLSSIKSWLSDNVGFESPSEGGFNPSTDLSVERVLEGESLNNQQPSGRGVANKIQVEFGAAITTGVVDLSSDGVLTFVQAGTYTLKTSFQFGRLNSTSVARVLFGIFTTSGVQLGRTLYREINSSNFDDYIEVDTVVVATAGLQIRGDLMRDFSGNNDGGLFAFSPTVDGGNEWNNAPSAYIRVERFVQTA